MKKPQLGRSGKNLEDVRRGEYEALKEEIGMRPERDPDFGPAKVGPAGGTIIGARQPLIAFNVYLTTDDVSIAQKIAKAVRNSSGGLRYVKALGLLVEGHAQVSMNLTNFRQTPIARVVEMVRREAARYGVGIRNSELVGLVPQEALVDAAVWYTQLDRFDPEQVLEHRLAGNGGCGTTRGSRTRRDAFHRSAGQRHSRARRRIRFGPCGRRCGSAGRHGSAPDDREEKIRRSRSPDEIKSSLRLKTCALRFLRPFKRTPTPSRPT